MNAINFPWEQWIPIFWAVGFSAFAIFYIFVVAPILERLKKRKQSL